MALVGGKSQREKPVSLKALSGLPALPPAAKKRHNLKSEKRPKLPVDKKEFWVYDSRRKRFFIYKTK